MLLGPLPVVSLIIQVGKNHWLLKLSLDRVRRASSLGAEVGGATQGSVGAYWTHPELLGLQVFVPPLVLIVIHQGTI